MSITFASPESSLDAGVFQHLLYLQDVLEFSRTSCFLMRSKLRISCVWLSGTNLARIRPGAKRSDSIVHVSLVAGHVLDMRGIRQHQLKFAVGQDRLLETATPCIQDFHLAAQEIWDER
jgi:hypothetical protein